MQQVVPRQLIDNSSNRLAAYRFANQHAQPNAIVSAAAEQDLIPILSRLLDTQNADMTNVMVAARIDAARYLDGNWPNIIFNWREALGDLRRQRN